MNISNRMRDKLSRGEKVIGTQLRSRSSMVAEIMGYCGYDYVFIDNEHFPCNPQTNENLIRTIQGTGTAALLRIADKTESNILQYLDAGADGIICPHVDTKEDALKLVKAGKYYPLGSRGYSNGPRSAKYGYIPMEEYRILANKNTWIMPMIESKLAVGNIEAILESGIDAIHIGQMDLSESYGYYGEQNHKVVQDAINHIIKKANISKIPVAIACSSIGFAKEMFIRGVNMVTLFSDTVMMKEVLHKNLEEIKDIVKSI